MPPQFNALSKDRFVVYDILPKEFRFVIRRAVITTELLDNDGYFVKYCYRSVTASADDVKRLNRQNHYILTDQEKDMLMTEAEIKGKPMLAKDYIGYSESYTEKQSDVAANI